MKLTDELLFLFLFIYLYLLLFVHLYFIYYFKFQVYIPGVYLVGMNEDINPGVGKYEISKEFAKDKLQFSM